MLQVVTQRTINNTANWLSLPETLIQLCFVCLAFHHNVPQERVGAYCRLGFWGGGERMAQYALLPLHLSTRISTCNWPAHGAGHFASFIYVGPG